MIRLNRTLEERKLFGGFFYSLNFQRIRALIILLRPAIRSTIEEEYGVLKNLKRV